MSQPNLTVSALVILLLGNASLFSDFSQAKQGRQPARSRTQVESDSMLAVSGQELSLEDFLRLNGRPRGKGGSRGDSFCPIAPLSPDIEPHASNFLSDRPTFVWEGEAIRIEVRPIGEDTAVWGKDLQPSERIAIYPPDQPALLPNKTYKLWFKLASGASYDEVTFSVLSADQRQPVQLALQRLVSQTPANQKLNKSAIAAKQAIYLGKQNLWLDAFGMLFSVPQSDISPQEQANWNKGLEVIRQSLCKPLK